MVLGIGTDKGTIGSIVQFNRRVAPAGTRFFYASIEPDVVGMTLHYALNRSLSDYLQEKLWQPIAQQYCPSRSQNRPCGRNGVERNLALFGVRIRIDE